MMQAFKGLLWTFLIAIIAYTVYVIGNEGVNLITPFFGEMTAWTWKGQFLFDFQTYLILSGLWVAWRVNFSMQGILLGIIAVIFGILFFAPYLLYLLRQYNDDWHKALLGKRAI